MKSRLLALLALTLGTSALNAAEAFLRPLAYAVFPTMNGYSNAAAGGLSGGFQFGSENQHEVSLEWFYTNWEGRDHNSYYSETYREHMMPWYATYRYYANTSFTNTRVYIGTGLGLTYSLAQLNESGSSYSYHWSYSGSSYDVKINASANIGAIITLARHLDLDLGYRYLYSGAPSYTLLGGKIHDDTIGLHLIYAGLNCRF